MLITGDASNNYYSNIHGQCIVGDIPPSAGTVGPGSGLLAIITLKFTEIY